MIIQCSSCGASVKKNSAMVHKFGGRGYCNRACFANSMRKGKIERTCEQCKSIFFAYPSSVKYHGARFCGKLCKDEFNHGERSYKWIDRPSFVCKNCGKLFYIERWRTKEPQRGQFCTRDCRYKYFVADKSYNWQGGITAEHIKIRGSKQMRLWRMAVLERDNYICVICGSTDKLEVDHIKRFSEYPDLRFAIDNGRTLCHTCHVKTDTYGNYKRDKNGRYSH